MSGPKPGPLGRAVRARGSGEAIEGLSPKDAGTMKRRCERAALRSETDEPNPRPGDALAQDERYLRKAPGPRRLAPRAPLAPTQTARVFF